MPWSTTFDANHWAGKITIFKKYTWKIRETAGQDIKCIRCCIVHMTVVLWEVCLSLYYNCVWCFCGSILVGAELNEDWRAKPFGIILMQISTIWNQIWIFKFKEETKQAGTSCVQCISNVSYQLSMFQWWDIKWTKKVKANRTKWTVDRLKVHKKHLCK